VRANIADGDDDSLAPLAWLAAAVAPPERDGATLAATAGGVGSDGALLLKYRDTSSGFGVTATSSSPSTTTGDACVPSVESLRFNSG
jgi:hypothetical protein